jgi:penicillin V acylase-like amidase (Ntn superfamily)
MVLPLHYAITDKAGNGLVVEFQNGKKQVYDNPVNVLTNGPIFTARGPECYEILKYTY